MKIRRIIFTLGVCFPTLLFSQHVLQGVTVDGEKRIEKAEKTMLFPTKLEKRHATNSFELLALMQIPELSISSQTKTISTQSGAPVVICINGVEVLAEDVATLRSQNVKHVEYIRNPDGKYTGKAALLNFITVQYDYGGNVYLSAKQGFAYKHGDYLAFTDFTKKNITVSLTGSADWAHDNSYSKGDELFTFSDESQLSRHFTGIASVQKTNNTAAKLRVTSTGKQSRFNGYFALAHQAMPSAKGIQKITYAGRYNHDSERELHAESSAISPTFHANYTRWLPNNQTLDLSATGSLGKGDYFSQTAETDQTAIHSSVDEKSYSAKGNVVYTKSFKNRTSLSAIANNHFNRYNNVYTGSSSGKQNLMTNLTAAMLQVGGSGKKYYYYLTGSLVNTVVRLNEDQSNYFYPQAYYGFNYTFNQQQSLSLNGIYSQTMFDPSNRNSMRIPISFFETKEGNPNLAPIQVFTNTLAYNGQFGNFQLSTSLYNYIYFDNIVHTFSADANTIYDTRINDGNFYGNMFTTTLAYNAFNNKLRLSATAIEEYNMMKGEQYDLSKNIVRGRFSASYLLNAWMVKLSYDTPYHAIDIREPYYVEYNPVYELEVRWNYKSWAIEAYVRNPFDRYDHKEITMDYGCYSKDVIQYNEMKGRNVNLKVAYNFGYGKKLKPGDMSIDKKVKSAILRSY